MVDERVIELINKEIDGTILPAERATLEQHRSSNEEVREISDDFSHIASMLSAIGNVEPPSTLKPRVMRDISPQATPQRQTLWQSVRTAVIDFFRPRSGFRLAYAFSGGLVAGVALFATYLSIGGRTTFDSSDAIGTMVSNAPRNLEIGREFTVNAGNVRGVVTTQHSQELSILTISLNTGSEVVTRISYDPTLLDIKAVRRSEEPGDNLAIRGGEIELRSAGDHTYAIYFGNVAHSASPVKVTIQSFGNSLFDNTITLGPTAR